jgi:hypothetical protein
MEKFRTKSFSRQFADEDYLILFKFKKNLIIPSSQSSLCCMFDNSPSSILSFFVFVLSLRVIKILGLNKNATGTLQAFETWNLI